MTVITDVAEIARTLGISRQRASELAESAPDFPAPEAAHGGRPSWSRRQVELWAASHPERGPAWRRPSTSRASSPPAHLHAIMGLAGRRAMELDHGWIGDEHLLLALLDPDCPGAARAALEACGLTLDAVRGAIIESVGHSFPTPARGYLSLSRGTQYVLERANLRAVELRDEQVSSEHALLALLEAPAESRGLALLAGEGVDRAALARRVLALTDRPSGSEAPDGAEPLSDEVHAAEVARILGVSRSRVAELAASASQFPRSELSPRGYRVWSRSAVESWAAEHPDRGPEPSIVRPPVPGSVGADVNQILGIAKGEASEMNYPSVLPDHLFLALLHPDCPGEARGVLESLGLGLEDVRRRYVESMGDPRDPHDCELTIPPATHQVLEQASLAALELADEQVTAAHILVALTQAWEARPWVLHIASAEVGPAALHERLMAETDGMLPVSEPTVRRKPWVSERRIPHPPEPELAPSPAGHDPRRRKPWGGAFFHVAGKTVMSGPQYWVDRDGYPVLTTDGQPVGSLMDEEGKDVLDEEGRGILTVIEVPEGSAVRSYPR